jgi:hypothetical protein
MASLIHFCIVERPVAHQYPFLTQSNGVRGSASDKVCPFDPDNEWCSPESGSEWGVSPSLGGAHRSAVRSTRALTAEQWVVYDEGWR